MKYRVSTFEIGDLLPIGLTLVVAGIGLAYGLSILGDSKEEFCPTGSTYDDGQCRYCSWITNGSFGYNATSNMCYDATAPANKTAYHLNQGADFNSTTDAIDGVAKIPKKMPLIATVIVAALIIGILVRYLAVRYN